MNVLLKFFASGSYNIIYIYANELFPTRIRNTGMGICSMVARNELFSFILCVLLVAFIIRNWCNSRNNK
jgi:hypothetical protein